MKSLISCCKNCRGSMLILVTCFAFSVLMQCQLFNYFTFGPMLEAGELRIQVFKMSVLPKLSISLLCAALIPLFRRKWWTVALSVIFGIWCYSEIVYWRIFGDFLTPVLILQVRGVIKMWDSVLPFLYTDDLLLLLPTAFLTVALLLFGSRDRSMPMAAALIALSVVLHVGGTLYYHDRFYRGKGIVHYNPLSKWGERYWGYLRGPTNYAGRTSAVHCLFHDVWGLVKMPFEEDEKVVTQAERRRIARFMNATDITSRPVTPLVIVLFESLESWAVTPDVMPNLCRFADGDDVMWIKNIEQQTRGGTSGDARMIVNTGLLPPYKTIVCRQHTKDRFPSLAEVYESSLYITTGDPNVWNDFGMSEAYGIRNYDRYDTDALLFDRVEESYAEYPYLMAVTMASHSPFHGHDDSCPFSKERVGGMLQWMVEYLSCVHYTDSCMGNFLRMSETDSVLRSATIVITGDHTIFNDSWRDKFEARCRESGENFNVWDKYVPFIVRSPRIMKRTVIENPRFQMDIYPTLLHLIGCDSTYWWKGFGRNLLDGNARMPISPDDATDLSEAIIKSDYFRDISPLTNR